LVNRARASSPWPSWQYSNVQEPSVRLRNCPSAYGPLKTLRMLSAYSDQAGL
jgi:hypothetical protein